MPRKGIPQNWKAAEHSTALAGVVKTMQNALLNGESVGQHKEEFLSQVIELCIALKWEGDLNQDLIHATGYTPATTHTTIKAAIVEQPKNTLNPGFFGGRK